MRSDSPALYRAVLPCTAGETYINIEYESSVAFDLQVGRFGI
jgi:hypothetical protein